MYKIGQIMQLYVCSNDQVLWDVRWNISFYRVMIPVRFD